jgi:uncharacterized protein DUF6390
VTAGPLLFIRYAYPPNERGLCGPPDAARLRGHAESGTSGPELTGLLRGFDGAWPYLELIAAANKIVNPLDERVVSAYWVGNELLDSVRMADFGRALDERFRTRAGRGWAPLAAAVPAGAVPHHSFHVFCAYPWVGLLREGRTEPSLAVLDSCRISWGRVLTTDPLVVLRRPLTWDGRELALGPPTPHAATPGFVAELYPGERVSLHWDRVCDRLTAPQVRALRHYTELHLRLTRNIRNGGVLS